ncbi:MAG: N-acetyltransferase [Pseudomonadaceae bacterium]|nr:MAG: N-acetyltransferase [Pseudomonadaceae bacterium]
MHIRAAREADFPAIWPIFQQVAAAGDTYAYAQDIGYASAERLWMQQPRCTWVAECDGQILGTYYLKTNQQGPGAHVCNCGYMVAAAARGQGLARAMCEHSQQVARELGYLAMQFNFVAASNTVAVALWQKLGFGVVGQLPKAFKHPQLGYVDALVMYKWLAGD